MAVSSIPMEEVVLVLHHCSGSSLSVYVEDALGDSGALSFWSPAVAALQNICLFGSSTHMSDPLSSQHG